MQFGRLSILIIDDSPEDRAYVRYLLEQDRGVAYELFEVDHIALAINECRKRLPACALLDFRLPDGDGTKFLRLARKEFGDPLFPVVMLAGSGSAAVAVEAMKLGASDYVEKEKVDADGLRRSIRYAIDRQQLMRAQAETQKALGASHERLSLSLRVAGLGISDWDFRTGRLQWDDHCEALFGLGAGTFRGTTQAFLEGVHPGDREMVARFVQSVERQGVVRDLDFRCIWPNGSVRWITVQSKLDRTAKGEPARLLSLMRDITDRRRQEELVRENATRLDLALQGGKLGTWDWHIPSGRVTYNERWAAMLGYELGEIEPHVRAWEQLVHPDDSPQVWSVLQRHLEGEAPFYEAEHRLRHKNGSWVWVVDSGRVYERDAAGNPVRAAGTHQDTTQRRIAEDAVRTNEQTLRMVYEGARIGTWVINLNTGELEQVNNVRALFGRENIPDRTAYMEAIHPGDHAAIEAARRVAAETGRYDVEFRVIWPDGSLRWIEAKGGVFYDAAGQPERLTGIHVDVTARRWAEEELRRSNQELERFASVASHDLQEPLRMVRTYSQLLANRYGGKLDPGAADLLFTVLEGSRRMQDLIEDLLAYARAGHSLECRTVDLNAALSEALVRVRSSLEDTGGQVVSESLPMVSGHFMQIVQVLQNLIGNAIKYRHPDRPPRIRVTSDCTGPAWVIGIRDNGMGFSPEYASQIFLPFKRLESGQQAGTGLGLAICQRIIERCGGEIWAESEIGTGSGFYFRLPAIEGAGGRARPSQQQQ